MLNYSNLITNLNAKNQCMYEHDECMYEHDEWMNEM